MAPKIKFSEFIAAQETLNIQIDDLIIEFIKKHFNDEEPDLTNLRRKITFIPEVGLFEMDII